MIAIPPDLKGPHTDAHRALHKHDNAYLWASDYASIQAAFDAAVDHAHLIIPNGVYSAAGLNLCDRRDVTVEGISRDGVIIDLQGYPLEIVGSTALRLENFTLRGNASSPPPTGLFMARGKWDGSNHRFTRLTFTGVFGLGCIVNYSSDSSIFEELCLWPTPTSDIMFSIYSDAVNALGIKSQFTTIAVVASNSCNIYRDNRIGCSSAAKFVPFWIGDGAGFACRDTYAFSDGPTVVRLDGNRDGCIVDRLYVEHTPATGMTINGGKTLFIGLRYFSAPAAARLLDIQPGANVQYLSVELCKDKTGIVDYTQSP